MANDPTSTSQLPPAARPRRILTRELRASSRPARLLRGVPPAAHQYSRARTARVSARFNQHLSPPNSLEPSVQQNPTADAISRLGRRGGTVSRFDEKSVAPRDDTDFEHKISAAGKPRTPARSSQLLNGSHTSRSPLGGAKSVAWNPRELRVVHDEQPNSLHLRREHRSKRLSAHSTEDRVALHTSMLELIEQRNDLGGWVRSELTKDSFDCNATRRSGSQTCRPSLGGAKSIAWSPWQLRVVHDEQTNLLQQRRDHKSKRMLSVERHGPAQAGLRDDLTLDVEASSSSAPEASVRRFPQVETKTNTALSAASRQPLGEFGMCEQLELESPKEFKPIAEVVGVDANHLKHAMRCKKRGMLAEALLAYNRADVKKPNSLVTIFNRAVVLHMMSLFSQAVVEYSLAIDLNPANPYAYFNRAASLYSQSNAAGISESSCREQCHLAVEDLDQAIDLLPERHEFHVNRALCFRKLDNFTQASSDYLIAMQLKAQASQVCILKGFNGFVLGPHDDPTPAKGSHLCSSLAQTLRRQEHAAKLQQNESGNAMASEDSKQQEMLDRVADVIWTSPSERAEEKIDILADFVKYSKVFRELSMESLRNVCNASMRREAVSADDRLYIQGNPPKAFYVLVSGLVTLQEYAENGLMSESVLVPGDVFGKEYALRWPTVCSSTAVAKEHSQLIKMDCDEYEAAIQEFREARTLQYMSFLQQVDFISEWPIAKVEQIASRIQNQICDDRQMVLKTGDVIEGIHFVWTGSLRLMRYFERGHASEVDGNPIGNESQIAELKSREYIGEEPCIRTEQAGIPKHQYDVIALGCTELLFIRTADIIQHFRGFKSSAKKIKQAHRYPDDNSLREQLDNELEWKEYKEQLLKPLYKPEPPKHTITLEHDLRRPMRH